MSFAKHPEGDVSPRVIKVRSHLVRPRRAKWVSSRSDAVGDSKPKSRQAAKQQTREALIRAGMSLFSDEGVDLPSLDSICARAGFTRGAFYVHFRHRDDFLEAVLDRVLVDFIDTVVAVTQSGDDLSDTIRRFLQAAEKGKVPIMADETSTGGSPGKISSTVSKAVSASE